MSLYGWLLPDIALPEGAPARTVSKLWDEPDDYVRERRSRYKESPEKRRARYKLRKAREHGQR